MMRLADLGITGQFFTLFTNESAADPEERVPEQAPFQDQVSLK